MRHQILNDGRAGENKMQVNCTHNLTVCVCVRFLVSANFVKLILAALLFLNLFPRNLSIIVSHERERETGTRDDSYTTHTHISFLLTMSHDLEQEAEKIGRREASVSQDRLSHSIPSTHRFLFHLILPVCIQADSPFLLSRIPCAGRGRGCESSDRR